MFSLLLSLLVGVVGLIVFALAKDAKLVRIGEVLMFVGFFWAVYFAGGERVHLP